MKIACVLAVILCLIFESKGLRSYKRGRTDPDQVLVYDNTIKAEGEKEFEYPEFGYKTKFLVTEIEVIDHICETTLGGNGLNNFYGSFQLACAKGGKKMESTFRVYGVYKGRCHEERQVSQFESETKQTFPKPE